MPRAGATLETMGPRGPLGRGVGSAVSFTHSMNSGGASVPCPKLPRVSGPSAESRGLHPPSSGRQRGPRGAREASDSEQGLPVVLEADT